MTYLAGGHAIQENVLEVATLITCLSNQKSNQVTKTQCMLQQPKKRSQGLAKST